MSATVYAQEAPAGSNIDSYNPATDTITWDPKSALQCTNGSTQSPALGLGHELEHTLGDMTGTSASRIPDGSPYGRPEERRVIDYYETRTARNLGEGTRSDHGGRPYQVPCVTCR